MISERMQIMIEYRDILQEILNLEEKILGPEIFKDINNPEPEPADGTDRPDPEPTEEAKPKKQTKKVTVDKGKIIALRQAGWSYKDIAEDVKCSENTVYNVLKAAREVGK